MLTVNRLAVFVGCVVVIWLWGIILNFLLLPGLYDIALRNLHLALGALTLIHFSIQRYNHLLNSAYTIAKQR